MSSFAQRFKLRRREERTKKTDDGKGIDGNFVVWTLRPYDLTHHLSHDVGQRQRVRRLPYMTYALKVGRKGQRGHRKSDGVREVA